MTSPLSSTLNSMQISAQINCDPAKVYSYASDPLNLAKWATGIGVAVSKIGDEWIADTTSGKIKIKFAEQNKFGVLDHVVTLPSGESFDNPMRVIKNGDGSEVTFTLFQHPGMPDEDFQKDAQTIGKDLALLKSILEK